MEVKFNGDVYPFSLTMGAIIDFQHLTGKDAASLSGDDIEGMVAICYCSIKSSSRAEGKDFPYSFQQFADLLTVEELNEMSAHFSAQQESEAAKKKPSGKKGTKNLGSKA